MTASRLPVEFLVLVALILVGVVIPSGFEVSTGLIASFLLWGAGVAWIGREDPEERKGLTRIYTTALFLRLAVAAIIYVYHLEGFFGPDAQTYNEMGEYISGALDSGLTIPDWVLARTAVGYEVFVGILYWIVGRQPFVAQVINCFLGSLVAVLVFKIAKGVFGRDVAVRAGWLVAVFPSCVIWTCQFLKDPAILFFICVGFFCILKLYDRWDGTYAAGFVLSLAALLTLRSYVAYIMAAATMGTFLIGDRRGPVFGLVSQFVIVLVVGYVYSYIRHLGHPVEITDPTTMLARISEYRRGGTLGAGSAFYKEIDISTPLKALAFLPLGLAYLMLGPFPWMVRNVRQAITIPEVLLWWATIPYVVRGIGYSFRHRLRQTSTILVFSAALMVFYALFEGNLGTAYRQRAQILIFFLIFGAVGWTLRLEEKAEREARRARRAGVRL